MSTYSTPAQIIKLEQPSKPDPGPEAHQLTVLTTSEGEDEEVSYVLLVEGDGEEDDDEDFGQEVLTPSANAPDLKVFDFEEEPNLKPKTEVVSGVQDECSLGPVESGPEGEAPPPTVSAKKKSNSTNQHMCNYCNYTSPKRYLLSRHLKSHSEERPHKCSVCERGFKTLASLQNHVNTHTGTKPHKCKYCESAFTTSGELVRHVRYRHTHEKPHHCTECDYSSVELSKLKRHMRCHTGERPYQCPHCTYASPDTFKLKRHLRIHTGEKPYSCDICGARFTQSNSLKAHRLIHTGQKPVFKCDLCPATCGRKTDLRIHVQKLHTSDKPLKCKRCGKTFPDRYNFKLHCKSHEGEKCFKCDLCAYASTSQRHLESHMLVHTDQKPWGCEFCDQSFRQKQLLRRHQNLYHNPNYIPPTPRDKQHECSECGRTFRHKGNLIRHMAIHDPESSVHERSTTVKSGRQSKRTLQMMSIDGQTVEVINDEDEDEDALLDPDDGTTQMIAVEGEDGQQYVVLEVIQLQDSETSAHVSSSSTGSTQQITLMTSNSNVSRNDGTSTPMTLADLQQLVVGEQHEDDGEYLIEDPESADADAETQILDQASSSQSEHNDDSGLDTKFVIKQEVVSETDVKTCFGFDDSDDDLMETEGTEDSEMLDGDTSYF